MVADIVTYPCRHGTFSFHDDDQWVGQSLKTYGDYSEDEISMFKAILRENDVAIEIGSNIGSHTVPMARMCKKVYAFEPHPQLNPLLYTNLRANGLVDKVCVFECALADKPSASFMTSIDKFGQYARIEIGFGDIEIKVETLDGIFVDFINELELPAVKIRFIKIDAEGSELQILKGGEKLIERDRPILYVENDRKEKSADLVGWLIDHGYRCYWHRIPMFYEGNFRGHSTNIFGTVHSFMMICIPEELDFKVSKLDEVLDHRIDKHIYEREFKRVMKRLAAKPEDFEARVLAGHLSNLMNREGDAEKFLKENLLRDPNHMPSLAIIALMQLQKGNYRDGWQGYELRYAMNNPGSFGWRPHTVPHWDGEPTKKRVLIWHEQGFGDSIMFGRFMDVVLERAPNAILEVQPQLYELFEYSQVVPKGQLFRTCRDMPDYDYHCSLPSIPALFKFSTEEELKRGTYLYADKSMIKSWLNRSTPRVGICTKGGEASERAYSRDMPRELAENVAKRFGPFMSLSNEGQWESYMDTAAAIMALDLVLTVDTSIAHLAGALGKKTILMLSSDPDFRWQKDREDTPWYPNMTIFRQKELMDWTSVIDQVRDVLNKRTEELAK